MIKIALCAALHRGVQNRWMLRRSRSDLRAAIAPLNPRVSKKRLFSVLVVFLPAALMQWNLFNGAATPFNDVIICV